MVLHKTMKMPSSCTMCWMSSVCDVYVAEKRKYLGYDNRMDGCPLEELPEIQCNGGTDFGNLTEIKALVADMAWRSRTYSNMVEQAIQDGKGE